MRRRILSALAVFGFGILFSSPASLQVRTTPGQPRVGVGDVTGAYEVVEDWPKKTWPRQGFIWGSQSGVFPETPNKIFLASRGEIELPKDLKIPPRFPGNWGFLGRGAATGQVPDFRNCILVVDGNGNLLESWTQWDHLFEGGRGPHSIFISPYDPERHVWVVDDMNHVIHKFTNDGKKLVMTLGEKGFFGDNDDPKHFRRPTFIDWLPDGTFFVSDGYGNTRVAKFDKDGKFLMWWGGYGKGPGQFDVPHGMAVGADRQVYVSDRSNTRVQVFDENGKFLRQWPSGRLHTITMSADQHLWGYDGDHEQFIKYDLNGHVELTMGRFGTYPGATWAVHQITSDTDGNLYAAEVFGGRTQKFKPKAGADPSQLVWGRMLVPKAGASND